jgi:hypothetical protein
VENFDQTRCFLVLKVSKPAGNELNQLLKVVNQCARMFELAGLYDNDMNGKDQDRTDCFHVSIGWRLKAPQEPFDAASFGTLRSIQMSFKRVKLKIGNVVTDIELGV